MQPVYLICQWAFRLKVKQRPLSGISYIQNPVVAQAAQFWRAVSLRNEWDGAILIKQYLRQGEIIGAEIARYSGDLRRVVWDQYSPKETLNRAV
jgi:hypothetical protein